MSFANKKVVVMGLGLFGGGVGVSKYFASQGARVLVTDLRAQSQLQESLEALKDYPIEFRLGKHCEEDFLDADLVIVNPGVPDTSPFLQLIQSRNIPMDTEIHIFMSQVKAPIVGITGSNGKSTTTAMIEHILKTAGYRTWLGGNIGCSLLEQLPEIQAEHRVILELSSFQLERIQNISPHISVITNLTPNHLDRHKTMENYGKAKQNILRYQKERDFCILNGKDLEVRSWHSITPAQPMIFGSMEGDVFIQDEWMIARMQDKRIPIMQVGEISLPGKVNQENAMAAACVGIAQGVPLETIAQALKTFTGLPHRLQFLGIKAGRKIYEDSDATTPESTIAAIETLTQPIVLLAGGSHKGFSYEKLGKAIAKKVKVVILMGETAPIIEQSIQPKENIQIIHAENIEKAIEYARNLSAEGDSVVLSPASASFGMFRNFVERAEIFKKFINQYFI